MLRPSHDTPSFMTINRLTHAQLTACGFPVDEWNGAAPGLPSTDVRTTMQPLWVCALVRAVRLMTEAPVAQMSVFVLVAEVPGAVDAVKSILSTSTETEAPIAHVHKYLESLVYTQTTAGRGT